MRKAASYAVLSILALFLMAPFIWMVLVSLQPSKAAIPDLSALVPERPAWENYPFVLLASELPILRFFVNSVIVAVSVVLGQLLICSLAAYGLSRIAFRGRETVFLLFLASMMFAGTVTQIPVYLIVREFGWLNTFAALIVPGLSSSFNVFLLRQFFIQIPRELDEAAKLDGAGDLAIWWRVIVPLGRPALATCAAFSFFAAWTDFFWPLLSTNSIDMRTLEVGLSVFKNSYGATNWPMQMTAAVIVMLPLVAVFLMAQGQFMKGIALGGLKE